MVVFRSKGSIVRFVSFMAFGVLVLGGFCFMGWHRAAEYRREVDYGYQQSLSELGDSLAAIDTALQKLAYASGSSITAALAGDISREAAAAQTSLGKLPGSSREMANTAAFLSRLGDWSFSVMRGNTTDDYGYQLAVFKQAARRAADGVGGADFDPGAEWTFGDSVKNLENEFSGLPTLIYDGPFSDHIEKRTPRFLVNAPDTDVKRAAEIAASYLDTEVDYLKHAGEINASVAAYQFTANLNGGECNVSISKKGGYPVNIINSRPIAEAKISDEQAIEKARKILEERGFADMRDRYYERVGNMLLINFAYDLDGIICYPDLIKVGIALDDGTLSQWDAAGFLMNHGDRDIKPPAISVEQGKAYVGGGLLIAGAEVCVIPTPGLSEILCNGYKCVDNEGVTSLIYVNAETGVQERILILIENENGTLTV